MRDCDVEDAVQQSQKLKETEEQFPIYVLKGLKAKLAIESGTQACFVYTLGVIGKPEEVKEVAKAGAKRLADEASQLRIVEEKESLKQNLRQWNRLMASLPDYASALDLLGSMKEAKVQPDVFTHSTLISKAPDFTYSTLISKAPDYEAAKGWLERMTAEGIQPNVFTYSTLISKAPDYEAAKGWLERMTAEGIQPNVFTYSTLISKAPDYEAAKGWLERMTAEGIQPDVFTYSTLISKAPDYEAAKGWLERMTAEGIQPDVFTYSMLISKAPDYKAAKGWLERMTAEGIQPDVFTYSMLISKAPDYKAAKGWLERMTAEGIQPNVFTYSTLFSKDLSKQSADDLLKWYLDQKYHPEEPIQAAIAVYRRSRHLDQALRLALDYPHLEAARKLIRDYPEKALAYFRAISEHDPQHRNAEYALGVALMELGKKREAEPHLRKALKLAKTGPRELAIKEWLHQIEIDRPSQNE
jgi:tetratricopeptide (TPR) repeat protein